VQGITDIITVSGVINRDFADVKTTMAGMGYSVMGTALRSGPARAVEAAQAAMASPLLEAGAIDGARGILINITGSSSLKLTEVNEASTIIQNAAHEDANIIFGAVQDESMGDEVKITVIATGFRHQEAIPAESQARRDRMLSGTGYGTGSPAIHYEVPISRVAAARAQFEAEAPELPLQIEPAGESQETEEPNLAHDDRDWEEPAPKEEMSQELAGPEPRVYTPHVAEPELIPVPRSVFDDDFFRVSARELLAQPPGSRMPSARGFDSPDTPRPVRMQYEEASRALDSVLDEPAVAEPAVRIPVLSGAPAHEPAEADELDIPAFLRRSH
jgi:cell division protein FtsZ